MPALIMALIAGFLLVVAMIAHASWRRGQQLARLRGAWGRLVSPAGTLDDRVAEAWQELRGAGEETAAIDARTWADLDLDRVVATIDRTQTALGRQRLYWRMRSGAVWHDAPELERLTVRFGQDAELRDRVGMQLASAGRQLGYGLWIVTRPELILTRWWYWSFPLLALAMLGALAATPFAPRALLVVFPVVVLNLIIRTATAWQIPGLLAPMRQMGPLIHTADRLSRIEGVATAEIRHDLKQLGSLRRIALWVSRDPVTSGELLAAIWEYLNLLFILDANALVFSAHHLRRLGPVLSRVACWVGDLDGALSIASLRAAPEAWCIPAWSETMETRVRGIWHPLVDAPVANDVDLSPGKGCIITGANMSGKSTYLRAVGIAAVLARAFDTGPATSWQGRAFRVRSLIGGHDDLAAGKSYYQVEADGVVALLRDALDEAPTVFLLDELLRGTNTIERLAAGEAVLRALLAGHSGRSPHVVIVATHDGELVSMLGDCYTPFHFRETVGANGLIFDYLRRPGPASTRTAIALLEATGAPSAVVAAARARAEELDAVQGSPGR